MIGFLCKIVQINRTGNIIRDKAQMKTDSPLAKPAAVFEAFNVVGNIVITEIQFEAGFKAFLYKCSLL